MPVVQERGSAAYASLFQVDDADKDEVVSKDEGYKFFSRFKKSPAVLDKILDLLCPAPSGGLDKATFCEYMRLISMEGITPSSTPRLEPAADSPTVPHRFDEHNPASIEQAFNSLGLAPLSSVDCLVDCSRLAPSPPLALSAPLAM